MTCLEFRTLLDRYVDQELAPDEKRSADEHLTSCISCREELASHQLLKETLAGHLLPVQPPGDYWDKSRERILARTSPVAEETRKETDTSVDRRTYIPLMRSVMSVAASVALLVTALVLGSKHDRPAVVMQGPGVEIVTSANLAELLISPDGGPLTLGDQRRTGQASILMGGPGLVGRFNFLPGLMRIY